MSELFDLRFKVGILGSFSNTNSEKINRKIDNILNEIRIRLSDYNSNEYGFNGDKIMLDFYSSPIFADEDWKIVCDSNYTTLNLIVPNNDYKNNLLSEKATTITNLNVGIHNVGTTRSMINWITNQIDIALLLWDGDEYSSEGYIWNFMEECKHSQIPCIWIDKDSGEDIYWFEKFYHENYNHQYLKQYIANLYNCKWNFSETVNDKIVLSGIWNKFYVHFINKYKIVNNNAKNVEDDLIQENTMITTTDENQKENYVELKKYYLSYDKRALDISKNYRESVYFRSILPFLSTIFISVGFYIEKIVKFLWFPKSKLDFGFLAILAGIGFLVQAAINCYGYYMAEDYNIAVKKRKENFLNCRYIAEYFRNAIHFTTFGISIKDIRLFRYDFGNKIISNEAFNKIHHIIRGLKPVGYDFKQNDFADIIDNLLKMIDNQINYHNSKKEQMNKIEAKLKKASVIIFWAGFIVVSLRGGLQFVFALLGKHSWYINNGVTLDDFIKTLFNMLALMLPAWASYFSLKLTMNNFDGLGEHSENAVSSLKNLRTKVEVIRNQSTISYEMIYSLSEDVIMHQIAEVNDWYTQTIAKRIVKL